jgi:uncharacterized protein RhaS with RHS repeats
MMDNNLSSGSNTTNYSYDTASNVGTVTYPNHVASTFSHDTLNRVTDLNVQAVRSPATIITT